jgi:hypothetical protein
MWIGFAGAVFTAGVDAQTVVPDRIVPDTMVIQRQYEETNRFYDNFREQSEQSRVMRRLYSSLVSEDDRWMESLDQETSLEKEVAYFSAFEGQTIRSVQVYRINVFGAGLAPTDPRALANSLHVLTRENKIWRNILFREGETVSPMIFARNEHLLRSLGYLSEVAILLQENDDGTGVDVNIIVQDSWSIGVAIRSAPLDHRYIDLYDSNILGSGNRLDLRTYVAYKGEIYGGNMLEYRATNLWGSFFQLDAIGGWGYQERELGVTLDKKYILPTDFIAGGTIEDRKFFEWETLADTLPLIHRRNFDVWAGKSWAFPLVLGSFYVGGRYRDVTYFERPAVGPQFNTYYHSGRMLLFNTGVYRETYYRGNMIYGYGRTENIPYGHRFELTAGKHWSEFGEKWYTAFDAAVGLQSRIGYLRGGFSLNSFWDERGKPVQGALELEFDGFSNLWRVGRNYLRQFTNISYTQGYNRFRGEGEQLTFRGDESPRGMSNYHQRAGTRLLMKNETAVFTPIYFYGFRFVFFGFADVGWIGNRAMPFKNDFYSTLGIGVRIKNERLIFKTIQLRLGVALNRHGFIDYRPLRFSSQPSLQVPEFRAERPEVFEFR